MTSKIRIIAFLCSIFLITGLAIAAEPQSSPQIIKRIQVEGLRRIEEDAVLAHLSATVGSRLDPDEVNRDLRAVFKMGYFKDVIVNITEEPDGVTIIYLVEEKPAVKEFVIEGNRKISDDKIKEKIDLKPNTILDEGKIKENIVKIQKLYEDEGYFMVDIQYHVEPLPNNRVKVRIQITEFKKVYIKRITFVGNRYFDDKDLKKAINTKEGTLWSGVTSSGIYKEELLLNDKQLIRGYYLDNGFVDVNVSDPQITLSPDKRWMFVSFLVEEGAQYYIGNVDITGKNLLFNKEDLMALVVLKKGELFSRSNLEKSINNLRNKYTDVGYAFAEVNPLTPKDDKARRIDITFDIDKGKLAYFEQIKMEGNTRTRDKVIRRELLIKEGDLYSGPGIRKSKELLMRTGYFDEVSIKTGAGSSDDRVNITIVVKERQQGSFIMGVGFSSLENFVGTAQISHNNLGGYGFKLNFSGEIGQYRKNISLTFKDPAVMDTKWIGSISLANMERNFFTFTRYDKSITISGGRALYADVQAHLAYNYEDVTILDVSKEAALFLTLQEGRTLTTSLRFTLLRDTTNSPFDPTDGSIISGSVEYATRRLGGDLNFIKYTGQARKYVPLWWSTSLMGNCEIGFAYDFDNPRLPLTERYFLGGLNSVRGFYSRSLGPQETSILPMDPNDPSSPLRDVVSVIGGNKYLQFNIEYLFPIVKELKIKGLLFFDAGNAFLEEESINLRRLRQAWGFGVRWISPLGPLRFEWGFPLYPKPGEEHQVFEFGIGTFF